MSSSRIPRRWRVDDASSQPLAYVHERDDQGASGGMQTTDEARRIAAGIARLPELLAPSRGRAA